MKKPFYFFYLLCKRQLKKGSFLIILLLLPILTFLFAQAGQKNNTPVTIALCVSDADDFSKLVAEKLTKREGIFHFYLCDDRETLAFDVEREYAECGYVFSDDLLAALDRGKHRNLIDVIVSPSTTMEKVTSEVVYSELFEEYSLHLLLNYLTTESKIASLPPETLEAEASALYRSHMTDGSGFHFTYENALSSYQSPSQSILLSPVRGIAAVFVFLSGFAGAFNYYNDRDRKVYGTLRHHRHLLPVVMNIGASVLFVSIAALLCILATGHGGPVGKELLTMAGYSLAVTVFCSLLCVCIPAKNLFCSTIPVFLLGSLILTPVFVDVASFIPQMRPVSFLFLPAFYLWFW